MACVVLMWSPQLDLLFVDLPSELFPLRCALSVTSRHVNKHWTCTRLLSGPVLQLAKEGDCACSTFGTRLRKHCAPVQKIETQLGRTVSDEE